MGAGTVRGISNRADITHYGNEEHRHAARFKEIGRYYATMNNGHCTIVLSLGVVLGDPLFPGKNRVLSTEGGRGRGNEIPPKCNRKR